jgi:hypothetical protein
MGVIDALDDKIHTICTSLSHKLQQFCGLTNYFIARVGVALTAISVIADVINYYHRFLPFASGIVGVVFDGLILISCISRSIACQRGDESVGNNTKPAHVLFYTERPFWRVLWVALTIWDTAIAVFSTNPLLAWLQLGTFSLGCAVFYNFIIVTPMPPGTNKVREWLSSFGRQPQPVPVSNS